MENWKDIEGFEGLYEVSDMGRVRSLNYNHTGAARELKQKKTRCGYMSVVLCRRGAVKTASVHRLVADAFVPNPHGKLEVNHKDEVKTNNAASNLEWVTPAENLSYGTRLKRIAVARGKSVTQIGKDGRALATFYSSCEAQRATGARQGHIIACCRGKRKTAGGYAWRYAE